MNIPEMRGIGLICEPRTLDEYFKHKRIKEEAERAARESIQRTFGQIKQADKLVRKSIQQD